MPDAEHQIPNEKFEFYSSYFVTAAKAGMKMAQTFYDAIDPADRVDAKTFDQFPNALSTRNDLLMNIESSYERILTYASSMDPIRDSFVSLSEHIIKYTGLTIDEYLEDNDLKITTTYAELSRLSGYPISSSNIDDTIYVESFPPEVDSGPPIVCCENGLVFTYRAIDVSLGSGEMRFDNTDPTLATFVRLMPDPADYVWMPPSGLIYPFFFTFYKRTNCNSFVKMRIGSVLIQYTETTRIYLCLGIVDDSQGQLSVGDELLVCKSSDLFRS